MRILLLSDTHGKLGRIHDLVEMTRASAVIHAGDFGFYDLQSVTRISVREVALQILHSDLPRAEINAAKKLSPGELRAFAAARLRLSDFPEYLSGSAAFRVPVYAVWGNHEDHHVVEALRQGDISVRNLHLLDERAIHPLGPLRLFGLGGNIVQGPKLFDVPLAGGGGKIWATLAQMAQLVALASSRTDDEIRILVTHVSPGREPLVWWLAAHVGADYSISGHMGMPYCVVWNEFSVREHETSVVDFTNRRERIEQAWDVAKSTMPAGEHRDLVEQGMALLRRYPVVGSPEKGQRGIPTMVAGRAKGEARAISFRDTFAINLPDADKGHAVLIVEHGRVCLETYAQGKPFGSGR